MTNGDPPSGPPSPDGSPQSSDERFRRLEELFHELADLGSGARRERLAELRRQDADLADQVAELLGLDSDVRAGTAALDVMPGPAIAPAPPLPFDIGPYRAERLLGEGGMGIVFEGRQLEPVRRRVAIKQIRAGFGSRSIVARFEAERQALAQLDHPNVARVFDAGTTPEGAPYFVMELVEGEPITGYCDAKRLDNEQRLELFAQLCGAVQHAHQRGIIHRDLKPSNILVAEFEGRPLVKVIDFGIARAVTQDDGETAVGQPLTRFGEMVGTPEYMSPEQAGASGGVIDTRTDVYALGVVLYELLVGDLPLDRSSLVRAGLEEIRRWIREVEPAKPSTRIRTLVGRPTAGAEPDEASAPVDELSAVARAAAARGTTPSALARSLRGDLDWIVLKALEKDPNRRYESPAALAADLQRSRNDEPVVAGPPTAGYRLGKFVLRHRVGVFVAAALLLSLVAGASLALWGLLQARDAQREAEQARDLETVARREAELESQSAQGVARFLSDLFQAGDPYEGESLSVDEVIDRGVERADELEARPEVRAAILRSLGVVQMNRGLWTEAEALLERALEELDQAEEVPEQTVRSLAATSDRLGVLYRRRGEYDRARTFALQAVELVEPLPDQPNLGAHLNNLAIIERNRGENEVARQLAERALVLTEDQFGEAANETAMVLNSLGTAALAERRYREGCAYIERTRAIFATNLGEQHPNLGIVDANLGYCLRFVGDLPGSLAALERATSLERRLSADNPRRLGGLVNLLTTQTALGRYDDGLAIHDEAVELIRRLDMAAHPNAQSLRRLRADIAIRRGEWAVGLEQIDADLERLEAAALESSATRDLWFSVVNRRAVAQRLSGDPTGARRTCERAMARFPEPGVGIDLCRLQLALIEAQAGRSDAAAGLLRAVDARRGAALDGAVDNAAESASRSAVLAHLGQIDRAFELLWLGPDDSFAEPWALRNPDLQPLHDDPRWALFAEHLGRRLRGELSADGPSWSQVVEGLSATGG